MPHLSFFGVLLGKSGQRVSIGQILGQSRITLLLFKILQRRRVHLAGEHLPVAIGQVPDLVPLHRYCTLFLQIHRSLRSNLLD